MIVVVDSYDSFVYNLVQYVGAEGHSVETVRNDAVSVADILDRRPAGIILSPGPGRPEAAGILPELVRRMDGSIPMLGVCLGHQAIGQVHGGAVVPAARLMHGKIGAVSHDGSGVHQGLPSPFDAVRYHSLVVHPDGLSERVRVNAWSEDASVMGLSIPDLRIHGVQYHPESLLTDGGRSIIRTFLGECRG